MAAIVHRVVLYGFLFVFEGYHVYQSIWIPSTGEILDCQREVGNAVDRYVVKVLKNDEIVGHLPKRFLRCAPCSFDVQA